VTWLELNKALMACRTERAVERLVAEEMARPYPREQWVLRCWCRHRRLRAQREVRELKRKLRKPKSEAPSTEAVV
jgi:hypothetical protein